MIDVSRWITRNNRKYLRLFTSYIPKCSVTPVTKVMADFFCPAYYAVMLDKIISDIRQFYFCAPLTASDIPTAAKHGEEGPGREMRDDGPQAALQQNGESHDGQGQAGSEKYKGRGSTAPRKAPYYQEGRPHLELKLSQPNSTSTGVGVKL